MEASPAHSMSMLSTDSTDASPHISYEVLRLVEEANSVPSGRGSIDAVSQSSSRSSPSLDMAKSDVEDVNDRSMSIEAMQGIPDLELIRAPVPVAPPADLPNPSSLQLPKAKNYVPARAWGSTATVDSSKEDASPGSPLKARRTYRRHQTMTNVTTGPVGPGQSETQKEEVNERRIKSLEGQKIYDVYYWEEVIQEDGDGGKVVVCRKKTEDNTGDFDKVMKIKSKLKLKKEGCADDYRKVLTKMLSLPPHPGVMPVEEALGRTMPSTTWSHPEPHPAFFRACLGNSTTALYLNVRSGV